MTEQPRHHKPLLLGPAPFADLVGDVDPSVRSEVADRCATLLVRGPRDPQEEAIVERVVRLADDEGLEEIAELWAASPPDSLAGSLWRLYLIRAWVYADPAAAAREFDRGRMHTPVHEVVAGAPEPPGPEDVQRLADAVLRGVRVGDYADALFRAAAFARVVATGRAHTDRPAGTTYDGDLAASRLMSLAEQLENAGRLELAGRLA